MIIAWLRFIIGGILLLGGLCVELLAILSVFRFNYVLNRMQISATADTLGLLLIMAGLMVFSGWSVLTLKLLLIILFFWIGGPVSSHMIAEIELLTNRKAEKEFEIEDRT